MVETHEIPGVSRGRRLAVGGMGELFLGQRATPSGPEPCVIKELLPRAGDLERDLFAREAEALAALTRAGSQRIVRLLGAGPEPARPAWLLLEWVDGVDLLTLLEHRRRRGRPLPLGAAHAVVLALAEALVELEGARAVDGQPLGLVHRDLHPGNVLLGRDGSVKLADLGVATFAARAATDTDLKGTLAFMAPEQLRAGRVSPASDLYAAALVAYEALTGVPARPTGSGVGLGELLAARASLPTAPSQHRAELAGPLEAALLSALAVDPSARPSPKDWLAALRLTLAPDPSALAALVAATADGGSAVRAAPTLGRAPAASTPTASASASASLAIPTPASAPASASVSAPTLVSAPASASASAPTPASASSDAPVDQVTDATPPTPRSRVTIALGFAAALGATALLWGLSGQAPDAPRQENEPLFSRSTGPTPDTLSPAANTPDALAAAPDALAAAPDALRITPTPDTLGPALDTLGPALDTLGPALDTLSPAADTPDALAAAPDALRITSTPDTLGPAPETLSPTSDTRLPTPDTRPPQRDVAPLAQARHVLVRPVDGPVHVADDDGAGLAPRATPAFGSGQAVIVRLTGGARPMKATVRLARQGDQGDQVLATVGAPRDTVLQVACGGTPERPTPVTGLIVGPAGLTCRLRTDDGRTMAFALVDERR